MKVIEKFKPLDVVAVLIILLCFIYMTTLRVLGVPDESLVVSSILLTVTGFYFGRKSIESENENNLNK